MNQYLKKIRDSLQQNKNLAEDDKEALVKLILDADKQWTITEFKLDRTEKVKKTTAILLEETIEELEQKRKAVEAQNHELEIESALERVRTVAMGMRTPQNMLEICSTIAAELNALGINEIRNVQTAIFYDDKGTYTNYEFYLKHDKAIVTETEFRNHPVAEQFAQQMMKGPNVFFTHSFTGNELNEWLAYQKTTNVFIDSYLEAARSLSYYWYSIGPVALGISTYEPLALEQQELFKRFRNVFELAYRRYLDIEKAQAQAREAQIETSLERVRSRTMAMYKSSELLQAAEILFDQVRQLGADLQGVAFAICNKNNFIVEKWTSIGVFSHPHDIDPGEQRMYEAWKNGIPIYEEVYEGEKQKNYFESFMKIPAFRQGLQKLIESGQPIPTWQKNYAVSFQYGYVLFITTKPFPETNIFLRFGKVFEQTYTRFLDLQKAEAQAREAQIEAALERVRSRTMGMQKSDELKETIQLVYHQMVQLGLFVEHAGFIIDWSDTEYTIWLADKHVLPFKATIPYFDCAHWRSFNEARKNGTTFFANLHSFEEKNKFYNDLFELLPGVPQETKDYYQACAGLAISTVLLDSVGLYIENFSGVPYTDEENGILMRFAKVFQQTYARFLDLKKAEAQAREAQIEAGLERVRGRAMGMQSSEEVNALIGTIFSELTKLDLVLTRSIIWVFEPTTNAARWWMANVEEPSNPLSFLVKYHEHPAYLTFVKGWQHRNQKFVYDLKGQDKINWDNILFNETELKRLPDAVKNGMRTPERVILSASFNNFGGINVASLEPLSEEHFDILLRFAKVFDLTYTRFLDLKKAEVQARKATIEAALEKVRGKAMAMHNSNDLASTASMVFTELRKLDIRPIRCGVGLLNKESRKGQLYSATSSANEDNLSLVGWVQLEKHAVLEKIYDTWLQQQDYFPELKGEQLRSYYQLLLAGLSVPIPDFTNDQKQFGHFIPFSIGCLYAWSDVKYDEEQIKILKRFASIIDLTFRRYIELQQSEANTKEAIKQAALDRIRADIASMRTVSDLNRITPLIWDELTTLNVPFIRCGVFIMDETEQLIHTFLSTPDGKAIAAFHLPYTTGANISRVLENWKTKSIYTDYWDEKAFGAFADELVRQGALNSIEQYLSTSPKGGFYLHFLPFLQGMLYVGGLQQLSDDEIKLTQSVADAFSTAYARYEDFNKLEAAKKQVDKTLIELKQTQQQLVQSEKMASLGELTAGIAHEIQNPLNFVNNFAEINTELVDELKNELEKGNIDEVKFLATDLKDNNDKIAFHGKRAESIVKGMLQHSRTSTGKKELADINALADEFLRLSYHGLRAKDKSFNATMETSFDYSIEKVKIIPQDLGRVLLNLFNNAFYSVNEKKKMLNGLYEPKVFVSTEKLDSKIQIVVKDNGNGIPQKIIDKIYHPFFTTKPTGEGTGLGLSLSYDIITKGHNGELKVETKEGEFASFKIILPT